VLDGWQGDDLMLGGSGDDQAQGMDGDDLIWLGSGSDQGTFEGNAINGELGVFPGHDFVADFTPGEDKVWSVFNWEYGNSFIQELIGLPDLDSDRNSRLDDNDELIEVEKIDLDGISRASMILQRWFHTLGQFGGWDKLGSGCRQAANLSMPAAPYASSGVRPARDEWGRLAL
jgi:hypothetical protein